MNAIVQLAMVAIRFLNPVRNARWTISHASHPMSPESRAGPSATTARKREIVAIDPRSR